jgi:hypothetical protein
MAAPESTIKTSVPPYFSSSLPSVFRAIECNLQLNYRRQYDERHGYYWIYRVASTKLSAHIYPNVNHDHDTIKISIFDDSNNPDLTPDGGELIKRWSTQLRMTGKWRRRLRRSTGLGQTASSLPSLQKATDIARTSRQSSTVFRM